MSFVRVKSHLGGTAVLTQANPGEPGFTVEDALGYLTQGDRWQIVIAEAKTNCWIVFNKAKIFGTCCEELAAGESIVFTSDCPKEAKTDCWFTVNKPSCPQERSTGEMAAADGKPGPGPIHTIPPLIG